MSTETVVETENGFIEGWNDIEGDSGLGIGDGGSEF